ncbi:MAG: TetR/AcrR family transcriptional regulator [Gammaproteobacteria bacterium]|jgi:AcrR family transcriptional regulator|nr:TetR/AcrR family transcriptional regulator [Gammaproteobacteria bacterium]MBU1490777.1 TetR/AcrR family transcriptional regulator [Gammaproteobacteria bacterium]MBU2065553.1 TetR/AcrR family transcriptional regulator [Gammaproteobacteria bacterium]MBU2140808.1 TetR/AcrR family transcriptional regulator [Gammaproteobacteria bacterium]MBU2217697.1 TetR/AcrR family transcriptional regulator [Gammaproteobacteria bacterium]
MAYRSTPLRIDRDHALRERILECALSRVADGGFAALTMQALADDVGIATGSLYRHFRSKGELAADVFASASQREVDALGAALRGPGDPAQRLAAGIRQFAARAWHSRRLAFALIAEPVDPEVDEQRLLYREAYAELFSELLEEGRKAGVFQLHSASLIAACLVGAIAEALVGPLSPPARAAREAGYPAPALDDVSQGLVLFCLRAVGVKEPM